MASLAKFGALRTKFSELADFASVYIAEAHPVERANFTGNIAISTHEALEDRLEAARVLQTSMEGEDNTILVDSMEDVANKAYAALPERLYVILDGKVVLEGKTGPFGYNIAEIESFLESYKSA